MKYIALTFKNIKKFVIHHPVMFALFIMVQIICCVAVFISCGMAYNMNYVDKRDEEQHGFAFSFIDEEDNYSMSRSSTDDGKTVITFSKDGQIVDKIYYPNALPFAEYKDDFEEFIRLTEKYEIKSGNLRFYTANEIDTNREPYILEEYYTYFPQYYQPTKIGNIVYDLSIYANSDENVLFSYTNLKQCPFELGKTYNINGTEFRCIGENNKTFIPYHSIPDDFSIYAFSIAFEQKLTQRDIDDIINIVKSLFPVKLNQSEIPEAIDPAEIQLSHMLFIVSIFVMIIVIFAIAKFYSFILSERGNNLIVFRLCGCTRGKVHIIYMLEIFLTMIVTSVIGFVLFKFVFFKGIAELYPSFKDFYTDIIYVAVLAVYIVLAMIIMAFTIIPSTKASITDMKRNR